MWSRKQRQVFDAINDPVVDTIIVPGPTQSGKSISAVTGFLNWASTYAGMDFIIGSHTQRQLEASVLATMHRWSDHTGCRVWREGEHLKVESRTTRVPNPMPNTFWTILGSNAAAERRARSFPGVKGGLIDEGTLWPEGALNQVIARLSAPNSMALILTNPAGPMHPLKAKLIDPFDPSIGGTPNPHHAHIPFELDDNPSLTDRYKERIASQFTGADYDRMVLGLWAAQEGAVYPSFNRTLGAPPTDTPMYYSGSGDFGMSNATAVGLWAHYPGGVTWLLREWYHDGAKQGSMPVDEQAARVATRLFRGLDAPLRPVVIDSTATDFIRELKKLGVLVVPADNNPGTLLPRIQLTNRRIEDGTLRISPNCKNVVRSMSIYRWDERRTDDHPLKQDDHGADMVGYRVWADGGQQAAQRRNRPIRIARAR